MNLNYIISKIYKFLKKISGFGEGNNRSNLAKKNITTSLIIKCLNIAVGLILIPLMITYLDETRYGVWVTISSIIGWFGFFDIGLGNGLRNKFAEAKAKGDENLAKIYVSTTYCVLSFIVLLLLLTYFIAFPFLSWNNILNVSENVITEAQLSLIMAIVFTLFCAQFVVKIASTLYTAIQLPAYSSFFDLLIKVFTLALIFILIKYVKSSLLILALIVSGTPVLILTFVNIWAFKGKFKKYTPTIKTVKLNKANDLFSVGVKFFFIQVAVVILYQTDNIIISQLFSPASVTPYNIVFKYFSILMMVFSILVTPFWSAITEAWANKDFDWIKNAINKLSLIWILFLGIGIFMLLASDYIYIIWVGNIEIPEGLSASVGIWIIINLWNSIFSSFLNGVGKLKIQIIIGILSAVINIPLSILLGISVGINGVIYANIVVSIIGALIYPIQYYKLINNKALGIWNE